MTSDPAKKAEAAALPRAGLAGDGDELRHEQHSVLTGTARRGLDAKLEALAELHEGENAATSSEGSGSGQTTMIAVNEATAGELAAAKDLIRVRVMSAVESWT